LTQKGRIQNLILVKKKSCSSI